MVLKFDWLGFGFFGDEAVSIEVFCFFRRECSKLSAELVGLDSGSISFRLRGFVEAWMAEFEAGFGVGTDAEEPPASLAAERVTLEDMRIRSVYNARPKPPQTAGLRKKLVDY